MTLDELWSVAKAEPAPSRAHRRFWRELERELDSFFACYSASTSAELTQSTLLVVWQKIHFYEQRGPDSLRRWVRAIAAKEALAKRPRATRVVLWASTLLRRIEMRKGLTPSRVVLLMERSEVVKQALARLSRRQRAAIELLDYAEIADAEGITIDAARMLLYRTIRKLAKLVDEMRRTSRVRVMPSS